MNVFLLPFRLTSHVFQVVTGWHLHNEEGEPSTMTRGKSKALSLEFDAIWKTDGRLKIKKFRDDDFWKGWGCNLDLSTTPNNQIIFEIRNMGTEDEEVLLTFLNQKGQQVGGFNFPLAKGKVTWFVVAGREDQFAPHFYYWARRFVCGCLQMGLPVEGVFSDVLLDESVSTAHERLEWSLFVRDIQKKEEASS